MGSGDETGMWESTCEMGSGDETACGKGPHNCIVDQILLLE